MGARPRLRTTAALLLVLGLVGCAAPAPATSAPAKTAAVTPPRITIAYSTTSTANSPLQLA